MEAYAVVCRSCSRRSDFDGPIPRRATCPGCGVDLRCCRHCRHWDVDAYNECSEPSSDRVLDKEAANFCDWFQAASSGSNAGAAEEGSAVDALEKLFNS